MAERAGLAEPVTCKHMPDGTTKKSDGNEGEIQCIAVYYRSASHVKIDIDIGGLLPIFSQAVNNNNTHAIHPIPSHPIPSPIFVGD